MKLCSILLIKYKLRGNYWKIEEYKNKEYKVFGKRWWQPTFFKKLFAALLIGTITWERKLTPALK